LTISSVFLLWSRWPPAALLASLLLPGSSPATETWPPSLPSFEADCSSRVWLERTTRPSGSNLSDVWVTRLRSKSALS
jgi:hypothetical protein